MAQALIPLKDLVLAKTRLAGMLSPSERRALAQCMLEDVLTVLCAHPAIERVTLLSDDPGAAHLCGTYGIDFLAEEPLGCRGLNPALQAAHRVLHPAPDSLLLVLHGDLPLLTAQDIDAALGLHRECGGLVIACDRHGEGTNLLAFDGALTPEFRFGKDSCSRHSDWGRDAGVPVNVLQRSGLGLDVDEPGDLELLLQQASRYPHCKTLQMLEEGGLAARLQLALAAAAGEAGSAGTGS